MLRMRLLNAQGFIYWVGIGLLLLSACKPQGIINQVKYDGQKYVNTCETFTKEVNELIERNQGPKRLRVSEANHTAAASYFLEEGQYLMDRDTLFFRLIGEMDYLRFLDDEVAIFVHAKYEVPAEIQPFADSTAGDVGTMVIDRAYAKANGGRKLVYKFPLRGVVLDGYQLQLSFAIAAYDKEGQIDTYFCETDTKPLGTIAPTCCTAAPWQDVMLPTVVEMPDLGVRPQRFVYQRFTGTVDVLFGPNSVSLADDSSFSTDLIQSYIDEYQEIGYGLQQIRLTGYASPPGRSPFNQSLSERRAESMRNGLRQLNVAMPPENILSRGLGEDWERVQLLIATSDLSDDQKEQWLTIAQDTTLSNDQREARMQRLPDYYNLKEPIMGGARHTFAVMGFRYQGDMATLDTYINRLPMASPELKRIANTVVEVIPYKEAEDPVASLALLEEVLTRTASPTLYAMRATYRLANGKYEEAFSDLEKASLFRGSDTDKYKLAIEGYKILYADSYDFSERKKLYDAYSRMIADNPSEVKLRINQTILMEKMGLLAQAQASYLNLFAEETPTAAQFNNRGVACMKAHRFVDAASDFEAAIAIDPSLAEPYFNLAAIYAYRGLPREVVANLDLAVERAPELRQQIFNHLIFSVVSEDRRFDKYRD